MKMVSPQTADIYKLLSEGKALSAQEIAAKLGVLPNVIYRATQKLVKLGMIEQMETYPIRFRAIPKQTATSLYMVNAMQSFRREFGIIGDGIKSDSTPVISLIKNRAGLLRQDAKDASKARYTIDFMVSGHEVPDTTILAFRKAITKGAAVRMIIHQKRQAYSQQTKEWKKIGADVRFLPGLDMRMFIYDKKIVCLTSYSVNNPGGAFGVRFDYPPLALQMSQLFKQNWQEAKSL